MLWKILSQQKDEKIIFFMDNSFKTLIIVPSPEQDSRCQLIMNKILVVFYRI